MKKSALFALALGATALLACPAPPEQTGSVPNQGPDGQGQPHMEQGQQNPNPGPQANQPMENEPGSEAVTDTTGMPDFEALIASGAETVTLSGRVDGVSSGFVDFQIVHTQGGWTVPKLVHQATVSNGAFSVEVPQRFAVDLYIVVVEDSDGNGASPDDRRIAYPEAVTVGTEDITLEFSSDAAASWEGLFSALPDPEAGNPVLDGPPPGAELNPTPSNPVPDGAEDDFGGLGTPNPDQGEQPAGE